MPKRINKKVFKCGHVGLGQECHRCKTGELLKAVAEKGGKYMTNKKKKNKKLHKVWTKKELLEESRRLLQGGNKRF